MVLGSHFGHTFIRTPLWAYGPNPSERQVTFFPVKTIAIVGHYEPLSCIPVSPGMDRFCAIRSLA